MVHVVIVRLDRRVSIVWSVAVHEDFIERSRRRRVRLCIPTSRFAFDYGSCDGCVLFSTCVSSSLGRCGCQSGPQNHWQGNHVRPPPRFGLLCGCICLEDTNCGLLVWIVTSRWYCYVSNDCCVLPNSRQVVVAEDPFHHGGASSSRVAHVAPDFPDVGVGFHWSAIARVFS